MKHFIYVALITLTSSISTLAEVHELVTNTFDSVAAIVAEKQEQYGADEVLLVFDLDNTLLTSDTDLGSDVWYQWQTGKFDQLQPTQAEKVPHLFDTIGLLYELGTMSPVEPQIPEQLQAWQQTGFTMMILTSRGPNYRPATERELNRAGINMALNALAPQGQDAPVYRYVATGKGKTKTNPDATVNQREISYINGIMMTSGMHKGSMLDHILEKTGRRFDAIIFVDDTEKNIRRMTESFDHRDSVDMTIIHYNRVEQDRIAEHGSILTQEQAEKMAKDWKSLNRTLNRIFPARKTR